MSDFIIKKYDVLAIDFETATNNNYSACSVAVALIRDLEIIDSHYWLIQPPHNRYSAANTAVHGLSNSDTRDALQFPDIWPELQTLIRSSAFVSAHNAQFDMSVLHEVLHYYQLPIEDFSYFDSINYSTKACAGERIPSGLKERCQRFNIIIEEHHNALSDALACGKLIIAATKEKNKASSLEYLNAYSTVTSKKFSELKASKFFKKPSTSTANFNRVDLNQINAIQENSQLSHPDFSEKSFVFTGEFKKAKDELMQAVVERGGIIKSAVSGKTDYVVEGVQDLSIVGADGFSSKQRKARELIAKGSSLTLLTEKQLEELL